MLKKPKQRPQCAVYTLGCKANQADSDDLSKGLARLGFDIVDHKNYADIYVVNTCTVTAKAAHQSRQAVRRFMKKDPGARVIVTGCDVEFEKDTLEKINGVSNVFAKSETVQLLNDVSKLRATSRPATLRRCSGQAGYRRRSRPFLKIQDGCENYCSYCIVPYVRGQMKSEPENNIIEKIKGLHESGYYETVLTGIHIGKYGVDAKSSLKKLLKRILFETKIGRIRLSSLQPDEIDAELVDIICRSGGRICRHLHIPLQSGSEKILKAMNRKYSALDFSRLIGKIKKAMPEAAIGADVITGFPGEGDAEFHETRRLIESLPLAYLHVFSYSDRKGTRAFDFENKVDDQTKKNRTALLRKISVEKRKGYLMSNIGKTVKVVFETGRKGKFLKGVSEDYIKVIVPDFNDQKNVHDVKLNEICGEYIIGEVQ